MSFRVLFHYTRRDPGLASPFYAICRYSFSSFPRYVVPPLLRCLGSWYQERRAPFVPSAAPFGFSLFTLFLLRNPPQPLRRRRLLKFYRHNFDSFSPTRTLVFFSSGNFVFRFPAEAVLFRNCRVRFFSPAESPWLMADNPEFSPSLFPFEGAPCLSREAHSLVIVLLPEHFTQTLSFSLFRIAADCPPKNLSLPLFFFPPFSLR